MPEIEDQPVADAPTFRASVWARIQNAFTRVAAVGGAVAATAAAGADIMNSRTSIAGTLKSVTAILAMLLTALGVQTAGADGVIVLEPGSGWTLIVGAVLYLLLTGTQAILSQGVAGTTHLIAAVAKILSGAVGTILTAQGIDVTSGTISFSGAQETWIVISTIVYFIASGTQAVFTAERNGRDGLTTAVGIVKALVGVLATTLLSIGIDVEAGQAVWQAKTAGVVAMILYGLYIVGSFTQALLSKDRDPVDRDYTRLGAA